ncbi:MAG: PqqD family protein [Vicinamibacterales bacterium]
MDEALSDGSFVLYHTGSRLLTTLNPTAALVWELCDGEHAEAAIVAEIQSIFPQAPSIEADVTQIIADLRSRGLLRPAPVEPAS